MTQSSSHVLLETGSEANDFTANFKYLKKLIQELKAENDTSLRKELFGQEDTERRLTKKEMKLLFKFMRKLENHYDESSTPPIPKELEKSIRNRDDSTWLPWETEAIHKIDVWRQEVQEKRETARNMLNTALDRIRRGEKI
ncbi:MAG: hypothetical protein AB7V04_06985 [Desulfomonilaceae bacterium]